MVETQGGEIMITFNEWKETNLIEVTAQDIRHGVTGGPPASFDLENRVDELEVKVDILMKTVKPNMRMRFAS